MLTHKARPKGEVRGVLITSRIRGNPTWILGNYEACGGHWSRAVAWIRLASISI